MAGQVIAKGNKKKRKKKGSLLGAAKNLIPGGASFSLLSGVTKRVKKAAGQ